MSVAVEAALIGAAVPTLALILSEVFYRQHARQSTKLSIRATFKKYAEPLAFSSTDLFWRLQEVFDPDGGGFYLKGARHLTVYEHYKAMSTLYRMANLLGWIRALHRELFFIPGSDPADVEELDRALQSFGMSLADGGHVEEQRVAALTRLWEVTGAGSAHAKATVGIQIDHQVDSFLQEKQVSSTEGLSSADKRDLIRAVATTLTSGLGCAPVTDGVIGGIVNDATRTLAVREAWIYRDWQAAIGDLVLHHVEMGQRQFEVIGYKDFEAMCIGGNEAERMWLKRLYSVIDDIDISGDEVADARICQLREVHRATAKIIEELHRADPKQSRISTQTRNAVTELLSPAST